MKYSIFKNVYKIDLILVALFLIYTIIGSLLDAKDLGFGLFVFFILSGCTLIIVLTFLNIYALIKYREKRIIYFISVIISLSWVVFSIHWCIYGVTP